jgi:hypothetical protein
MLFQGNCTFSRNYLPSWVPIHTVPEVLPDEKRIIRTQSVRGTVKSLFGKRISHLKNTQRSLTRVKFSKWKLYVVLRQGFEWAQWPVTFSLTSRGHSTDAEGRWGRGQAELVQHCVGACRVDHCDFTGGAQARHEPHRALTEEEDGQGGWKHDITCIGNGGYGSELALYVVFRGGSQVQLKGRMEKHTQTNTYRSFSRDLRCHSNGTVELREQN